MGTIHEGYIKNGFFYFLFKFIHVHAIYSHLRTSDPPASLQPMVSILENNANNNKKYLNNYLANNINQSFSVINNRLYKYLRR